MEPTTEKKMPWIIAGLLLIAVLGAAAFIYLIQEGPNDTEGTSSRNTNTATPENTNHISPNTNLEPSAAVLDIQAITLDNFPALDSSTSAQPLGAHLAATLLDVETFWETTWEGSKWMMLDMDTASYPYIMTSGTHGAYETLIREESDIILVARAPSQDELDYAEENGVALDVQAVARDAFVFIVNDDNNVDSMSLSDIRDIYTGDITEWSEVGGDDTPINPYQRNDNSGSQELMEQLVMKELTMIDAPEMILMSMIGPINALKDDPDGLGYSVFFYEQFMAPNEDIKLLGIDGVVPSSETIASQEYSLATEVFVAIRGDEPTDSPAHTIRNWLFTDEGQKVIQGSGYVPLL